jgi:hypothetical protein
MAILCALKRLALAALAGLMLSAHGRTPIDAKAEAQRLMGQAIYRDGLLGAGQQLVGRGAAGVLRQGRDAACAACHRRSGFGIAEGEVVVRPITAPELFHSAVASAATPRIAHFLGQPIRPAYDDAALAQALRNGIDITGRPMHSMMPRYALGEADMAALRVYLKSLYATPDPGVDGQEIHLATVVQPDVAPQRREAMLEVLRAFMHDKNAGVRSEVARRTSGAMRMQRAYRRWVLDVWELSGAPEGWGAQLEQYNRRQPVFALVSGIGELSWQPIQDFSERLQVPCILPLTSMPGETAGNFYTVYFSRGIALEAEALASHLAGGAAGGKVIQVFRADNPASLLAARAFRTAFGEGVRRLEEVALTGRMSESQWRALAGADAALVLWLGQRDLPAPAAPARAAARATWLSATLFDGDVASIGGEVAMTYPWELPEWRAARIRRSTDWLRARNLGADQLEVRVNAHFAIVIVGEALAHLMDSFSRDYFVETVEHNLTTTLLSSFYPPLTLGPDQRYASKGVYLVHAALPGAAPATQLVVP